MSNTVQSGLQARIESIARSVAPKAQEDVRQLFAAIVHNLTALSPGGNLLEIGGAQANASKPPVGVTHSVVGANGVATVAINNPSGAQPIYHEVSYSPLASFTKNVTTMPSTTATSVTIPQSGVSAFYRLRSSFDKKTWSPYQMASTKAVDAGLVASNALEPGTAFNQTNFASVMGVSSGSLDTVTVNGTGGPFSSYTAVKGSAQSTRPSATLIGSELGPSQFVGYDGSQFHLLSTLAGVFPDNLEPVGFIDLNSGTSGGGGASGGNGGRLTAV